MRQDNSEGHSARTYLVALLGITAVICCAVMLINALADPYGWSERRIWGRAEPDYSLHDREVHLNLIRRLRPQGLILGNSRAQVAFEPENSFFPGNTVNASVTHASLSEITDDILPYARKAGPLKAILVGIDFTMASQVKENLIDVQLAPPAGWQNLPDAIRMLLSFDTFMSSARIATRAVLGFPTMYGPRGNALASLYLMAIRNAGGQWALVRDDYALDISADAIEPVVFDSYFRKLLQQSCDGRLDATIVIMPRPAVYLKNLRDAGLWENFMRWQKSLVTARDQTCPTVKLWDFTAINARTAERPPLQPGDAPMTWFWDMSHVKTAYGRDMLKTMSGHMVTVDGGPLGVALSGATIDAHLRDLTAAVSLYQPPHPAGAGRE